MVKNLPASAGDKRCGLIPRFRRSLWEGHGNPLQYLCLKNPMDRAACGLQSMGLQRVRHNCSDLTSMHFKTLPIQKSLFSRTIAYACTIGLFKLPFKQSFKLFLTVVSKSLFKIEPSFPLLPFLPPKLCLGEETGLVGFGDFPGGSESKESACNAGDLISIPESGRSPGEGNGYPL